MLKQDKEKIKAIIFDLGGVILNINYQNAIDGFKNLGLSNFDELYSKANQSALFDELETGKISVPDFRKKIKQYLQNCSDADIDNAWNSMLLDLPEERIRLLRDIKTRYKTFLLSNTNAIHVEEFTKRTEAQYGFNIFRELFHDFYFSNEIGLRKPTANCFQFVLKKNKLSPEETLFIDDSIQHIEGANALGIHTYHIKPGETIIEVFEGW